MGLVLEGATNPSGVTVAALVVDGSITDPDGSAVEAIAITGLNTSLGTWQYSLDGGTNWLTINAELINNQTNELALLLGPTAQLRLIPFGDLTGSVSDAITFRAWDQTSGSEGQYTVITSTGGSTAFSSQTDTANVNITAVNDAPTFLMGDGIVTTAIGTGNDQGYSVMIQLDGKIVVAGWTSNGSNNDFALVRYNADGSLDARFDLAGTLGGSVSYTENGSAVVLDGNIRIFDVELSSSNFSGATLTLVRDGGASAQDLFSATGTLGALTQGGNLVVGSTTIGTVTTSSAGTLVLTFNSSATNSLVNSAMQQIAYANSSDAPPPSVQIDWTFSDGNSGAQGTGGALTATGNVVVNITAINDAPTAVADTATAVEAGGVANGTAGTNPTGNVLTNHPDPDTGDTKTVVGVSAGVQPLGASPVSTPILGTYGSINIAADGSYTYTIDNSNAAVQSLRTSGDTLTDTFTYTMQDAAGLTSTTQITVTIQGTNDAPNDLSGTLTMAENAANGSIVETITRSDVDSGDGAAYSLVDNAGGRFAINSSTGVVTVANTTLLNFEAATSHNITVRVTDTAGATFDKVMTVNLTDVDEFDVGPVIDLHAIGNQVNENALSGTLVGIAASAVDLDGTTNVVTYSLIDSAGGRFSIESLTGVVRVADGGLLDYESKVSHSIEVQASSSDGSTSVASITIDVLPVNEGPVAQGEFRQTDFVTPISIPFSQLLANDADPDGDALRVEILSVPSSGLVAIRGNSDVIYNPEVNFVGSVTILYTVTDGLLFSDPQEIKIMVTPPVTTVVTPPEDRSTPKISSSEEPAPSVTIVKEAAATSAASTTVEPASGQTAIVTQVVGNEVVESSVKTTELTSDIQRNRTKMEVLAKQEAAVTIQETITLRPRITNRDLSSQRLNLESSSRSDVEIEHIVTKQFVQQDERKYINEEKQFVFQTAAPVVMGTVIGVGVSLHVLASAQIGSTLLSQSGIFMPLDPMTILEGTSKVKKSKAQEDILFDAASIKQNSL